MAIETSVLACYIGEQGDRWEKAADLQVYGQIE